MSASGSAAVANGASSYENIQVVVRMRPMNGAERREAKPVAVQCSGAHSILLECDPSAKVPKTKEWAFDRVYDDTTTQAQLFDTAVAPVVDEVMRGYSCTVFAYGQTGTGKTHTMEGAKGADGLADADSDEAGIIPRAIKRVFSTLNNRYPDPTMGEWSVKISFLEIYNEKLDDLLSPDASTFQSGHEGSMGSGAGPGSGAVPGAKINGAAQSGAVGSLGGTMAMGGAAGMGPGDGSHDLRIASDEKGQGIRVQGLEEISVKTPRECFEFVRKGVAKRATAETKCNAVSSRSHCVFTLAISLKEVFDGQDMLRVGKLNLVDLAGSECVGRSGATDKRAREAGNINQSLLTLGRVITALVDKLPHVPYRDSKLTRLLQDSLGGRTKTCMIATVSPAVANAEETVSTLEYASRAKKIMNRPEACARVEKREVVEAMAKDMERLKARLRAQVGAQEGFIKVLETEYNELSECKSSLERAIAEGEEDREKLALELEGTKASLEATRLSLDEAGAAHAATTARLATTESRLACALSDLAAMTAAHEDEQAVVRGMEAVQAALTGQAKGVMGSLRAAAGDAAGLHSKVSRVSSAMAANRSAAEEYGASTADRLAALLTSAAGFSAETTGRAGALRTAASSFSSSTSADLAGILACLAHAKGGAVAYAREVSGGAGGVEEETGRRAGEGMAAAEGARTKACTAIDEGAAAQAESMRGIASTLEATALALAAWQEASLGALQAMAQDVEAHTTAHTAALSCVVADVQARARAVDALLAAHSTCVEEDRARAEAESAQAGADVVEALQAAVVSFTARMKTGRDKGAEGLQTSTAQARAALSTLAQQAVAGVCSASGGGQAWAKGMEGKVEEARHAVVQAGEGAAGTVMAAQAGVKAGSVALHAATASAKAGLQSVAGAGTAGVQSMLVAVGAYASKAKSRAVTAAEDSGNACEAASAAAGTAGARSKAWVETVEVASAAIAACAGTSLTAVQAWAAQEGAAAHDFLHDALRDEPITGVTPGKREYPVPTSLLASSPPARVAKRFRTARDEGMSVGQADGVAWAGKVAPEAMPPTVPVVPAPVVFGEVQPKRTNSMGALGGSSHALLDLAVRTRSASSARDVLALPESDRAVASEVMAVDPGASVATEVARDRSSTGSAGSSTYTVSPVTETLLVPMPKLPASPPVAPVLCTESAPVASALIALDATEPVASCTIPALSPPTASKRAVRATVAPPAPALVPARAAGTGSLIAMVTSNPATVAEAMAVAVPMAKASAGTASSAAGGKRVTAGSSENTGGSGVMGNKTVSGRSTSNGKALGTGGSSVTATAGTKRGARAAAKGAMADSTNTSGH